MRVITILFACFSLACSTSQVAQTSQGAETTPQSLAADTHNTITREQLVEMFDNMEGKYSWDLSKDMVWGYFFTHEEPTALAGLRPVLEQLGYRIVDEFQNEESGVYFLHAERIEAHSVDSLHLRNNELANLAFDHGVTYDGMDVGPQKAAE